MLTLYHGSSHIIEKPVFGVGNPNNDYGLGFYCTENQELAKEWASSSETDGFSNKYQLDMKELSELSLTNGDYHILNWLFVLLENRKFRTSSTIARNAKEYIFDNFSIVYKNYDIIKGYRADDSYFAFANAFLNNTISLAQLERAMALGKLGEQVVLMSEKAFESIEFIDAVPVASKVYYPQKMARDTAAREEFQKEKGRDFLTSEKYVLDIIREGWKNGDERLQRIVLR